jgi:hypothetical protein
MASSQPEAEIKNLGTKKGESHNSPRKYELSPQLMLANTG